MNLITHATDKCIFLLFLLCFCLNAKAQQNTISGEVLSESSKEKIEGATVVLKSGTASTAELLAYGITAADGMFCVKVDKLPLDSVYMEVKCIGFKPCKQYITSGIDSYQIYLKEEAFSLKEVTIQAQRIKQSGDTISYNIASFATAQNRSIGDVLSNMPGMSVADNGQISYNGSRINRLYIEGNDLFNEKYGIVTQNLSYKDIARAEIIENHQPVKVLASSNDDSKREVALNLKLKDDSKSQWGGYLQTAGGLHPETWEGELFVTNFSELFQSVSTLKSNNSGKLITNENKTLTLSDVLNMQNYRDSKLSELIRVVPMNKSDLSENRTKVGASHIVNNSNLWKLNKQVDIRSQIIYSDDHLDSKNKSQTAYFLTDSILTMNTLDLYNSVSRNLQGEWCIKSNQDRYYLNNQLHAFSTWTDVGSVIQHNDRMIHQEADNRRFILSNDFEFIKKYGKHILQVSSYSSYTYFPENLLLKDESLSTQTVNRKLFFTDAQASHGFDWKRWNFTTKANFQIVTNRLNSKLVDSKDGVGSSNVSDVGHLHLKIAPQIAYKTPAFSFSFQLPLSCYQYKKKNMPDEGLLFYMPEVFCKWKATPFFTLFASGAAGTLASGYDYMYIHPIMSNYKTISSGFLSFQGKKRARSTLRLSYANPIEMLFAHVSISGTTDTSDKQIEKTVSANRVLYNYKPGNSHHKMFITECSLQKGVDGMNGKIELHTMYQLDKTKIIQNAVEEPFHYTSFSTDLNIQSAIASWLELKYVTRYSNHRMKGSLCKTNHWKVIQQVSVVCNPSNHWLMKIEGGHYYNHYGSRTKQQILLCDINVSYLHRHNEWFCNIQNAFNERWYTCIAYDEMSSQTISYGIRPGTIMFGFRRMF